MRSSSRSSLQRFEEILQQLGEGLSLGAEQEMSAILVERLPPREQYTAERPVFLALALRLLEAEACPDALRNGVFRLLEHWGDTYAAEAAPVLARWLGAESPKVWQQAAASSCGRFANSGAVLARPLLDACWRALEGGQMETATTAAGSLALMLRSTPPEVQQTLRERILVLPEERQAWALRKFHPYPAIYADPELSLRVARLLGDDRMHSHLAFLHLDAPSADLGLRVLQQATIHPRRGGEEVRGERLRSALKTLAERGDVRLPAETLAALCADSDPEVRLLAIRLAAGLVAQPAPAVRPRR